MAASAESGRRASGGPVDTKMPNRPSGSLRVGEQQAEDRDALNTDRDGNELTSGTTPGQLLADDETRAPEEEGGDLPRPDQ